jgi:hypothetical protein
MVKASSAAATQFSMVFLCFPLIRKAEGKMPAAVAIAQYG